MTALIAAVSAAVCYDVAFTQPYGSIMISHPQDIETTALLLVGGLIVGQLSARNRRNRGLVVQQSEDLAHIQAIAELMAAGAEPDEVVDAVAQELRSLLGLRDCRFETSRPERPGPTIDRNGNVSWGRIWWGVDTLGLPGKEITIDVEHDQRRLGRYVLTRRAWHRGAARSTARGRHAGRTSRSGAGRRRPVRHACAQLTRESQSH